VRTKDYTLDEPELFTFRPRVVRLRGEHDLGVSVLHLYKYDEPVHTPGGTGIATVAYFYHLLALDGTELIAFHWHPGREDQPDFPHLHVTSRPGPVRIQRKHHVPTGRVSLEAVVRFAIQELGVRPIRPDWEQVLDAGQREFEARRSW
jgi:hypothetical protein